MLSPIVSDPFQACVWKYLRTPRHLLVLAGITVLLAHSQSAFSDTPLPDNTTVRGTGYFCGCTQTVYPDAMDCLSHCSANLGCFTAICTPLSKGGDLEIVEISLPEDEPTQEATCVPRAMDKPNGEPEGVEPTPDVTMAALKAAWNTVAKTAVGSTGLLAALSAATADPSFREDMKGEISERTQELLDNTTVDYRPEEQEIGEFFEAFYNYADLALGAAGLAEVGISLASKLGRRVGLKAVQEGVEAGLEAAAKDLAHSGVEQEAKAWVNTKSGKIHLEGLSQWSKVESNVGRGSHWSKMDVDEAVSEGYELAKQSDIKSIRVRLL